MIVGIIITTVIALSSCTTDRKFKDVIATYEVTYFNGDKEEITIKSLDLGFESSPNGVKLKDGCIEYYIKDPNSGFGGIGWVTAACNVRSFKLKPND